MPALLLGVPGLEQLNLICRVSLDVAFQQKRIWWIWPSWLRRQIVALKIVGSSPITHPIMVTPSEWMVLFLYQENHALDALKGHWQGGRNDFLLLVCLLVIGNSEVIQIFLESVLCG